MNMGGDEDRLVTAGPTALPGGRRPYWRSQSWSASRSSAVADRDAALEPPANDPSCGLPLLTPRSQQNCKARSCLPPLQPLAIARRSVDEWPKAGSDDVGDWALPLTPGARLKVGDNLKVDLSVLRPEGRRSQLAFFDKECSKVAEHIYLGGDAVARDREILRKHGITHVLNCVGFVCPEYFKSDLVYRTLWLQDSPSEDITSILYDVFDYFEDVREQNGRVLVHCCQGVSRSTSLVIAYLMWREGQSFEDAFGFVKAARGIANPNMGFACQLLQCQKRVHAIPLSPNSVLRMFRMAPHSPYDALHLVPKMLNEPLPTALDSRGAFIVHIPSSLYVWIGKKCESVMEKDAKAAAHQVVRYEKVPGPIMIVEEGREPLEFWEAFSKAALTADTASKVRKDHIDLFANTNVGKRKVDTYDTDFELFLKGLYGGVLPPFSSTAGGHETHIPARESSWSVLRRKFISGGVMLASKATIGRVYSDSMLARENDIHLNRVRSSAIDSASPPDSSPSSLSSDSSNSSKFSIDSPAFSPSADTVLVAPPPSFVDAVPSSRLLQKTSISLETSKFNLKSILSPSKRFGRSLAERRGSCSPSLKLSTLTDETQPSCQQSGPRTSLRGDFSMDLNACSSGNDTRNDVLLLIKTTSSESEQCGTTLPHRSPHAHVECRGSLKLPTSATESSMLCHQNLDLPSTYDDSLDVGMLVDIKNHPTTDTTDSACDSSQNCPDPSEKVKLQECRSSLATGLAVKSEQLLNSSFPLAYSWPDFKKIEPLSQDDLDSEAVFLILFGDTDTSATRTLKSCLWIGSCYKQATEQQKESGNLNLIGGKHIDWNQVGFDILKSLCLPADIPVRVVREDDSKHFLDLIFTKNHC